MSPQPCAFGKSTTPTNIAGTANFGRGNIQCSASGQRLVPPVSHRGSHPVRCWDRNSSLGKGSAPHFPKERGMTGIPIGDQAAQVPSSHRVGWTLLIGERKAWGCPSLPSKSAQSYPQQKHQIQRRWGAESYLCQCKNLLKQSASAYKEEQGLLTHPRGLPPRQNSDGSEVCIFWWINPAKKFRLVKE